MHEQEIIIRYINEKFFRFDHSACSSILFSIYIQQNVKSMCMLQTYLEDYFECLRGKDPDTDAEILQTKTALWAVVGIIFLAINRLKMASIKFCIC